MTAAIFKRAGGRRRHNKERQDAAKHRRQEIIDLLLQEPEFTPGWKSWLAEELEVHRGTIGRDIRRIVEDYKATGFKGLGPRSNAKKELLDRLSDWFTKRDDSRIRHNRDQADTLLLYQTAFAVYSWSRFPGGQYSRVQVESFHFQKTFASDQS